MKQLDDNAAGLRPDVQGMMPDNALAVSLTMTLVFLALSLAVVAWIFRTGYRLKR